jgi:Ca-activated chloride channel family protein
LWDFAEDIGKIEMIINMLQTSLIFIVFFAVPMNSYAFSWQDLWFRKDQQGMQLLQKGAPKEAAEAFESPAWRGVADYRTGNYQRAEKDFGQYQDAVSNYNRGNTLALQGKYPEAITAYEKALQKNPNFEDAQYNLDLINQLLAQKQQPNLNIENKKIKMPQDESSQSKSQSSTGQNQQQTADGANNNGNNSPNSSNDQNDQKENKQGGQRNNQSSASNSNQQESKSQQNQDPNDQQKHQSTKNDNNNNHDQNGKNQQQENKQSPQPDQFSPTQDESNKESQLKQNSSDQQKQQAKTADNNDHRQSSTNDNQSANPEKDKQSINPENNAEDSAKNSLGNNSATNSGTQTPQQTQTHNDRTSSSGRMKNQEKPKSSSYKPEINKPEITEQKLEQEQWLQQIPDDPAGLLREKFLRDHLTR